MSRLLEHCLVFSIFLFPLAGFTAEHSSNLLRDAAFSRGFEVMSPRKDIYTERAETETVLQVNTQHKKPAWRLVQWGSTKSLGNSKAVLTPDNKTSWAVVDLLDHRETLYKRLTMDDNNTLALEVNALAEFSTDTTRKQLYLANTNEFWPHLLVLQNLHTRHLDQYQSLELALDARLLFDNKNITTGYQKELHAARFVVSMAVRNTLSNNRFWLNTVVYDDRYPQSGFLCQKCTDEKQAQCVTPQQLDAPGKWLCPFDGERWSRSSKKKGTRRMLFRIPTAATTSDNIHNGDWAHYRVDLLPYINAGIEAAQNQPSARGFLPSLKYYDITLFSMGWEITGLNHAAMEVKNLGLYPVVVNK